jgi:hypothetical protein
VCHRHTRHRRAWCRALGKNPALQLAAVPPAQSPLGAFVGVHLISLVDTILAASWQPLKMGSPDAYVAAMHATPPEIDTGLQVYFCEPQSPWQKGANEYTNGQLRQCFPTGTDLSAHGLSDLQAVALALNTRPRKMLDWRTPAEAPAEQLHSAGRRGVAATR